jgi:probable rRNA maturation factor
MKISIFNKSIQVLPLKINSLKKQINYLAEIVVVTEEVNFDYINILICDDFEIIKYNQKYLKHNYPTDIISFNYGERNKIEGELIISLETVKRNSEQYKTGLINEFIRVIIHGILHLCGYEDDTIYKKRKMRKKEIILLNVLNENKN